MKMAGVKNEKDFYKKYPTEDHFFAAFPQMKEKGGPILNQWDLPSDPSTPGYEDYGDMYTVPQWPGLMYKDPGAMGGWEGFGNPANLITNQGTQDTGYGPLRETPTRRLAMDPSDYSIDKLRASYAKDGGYTNPKGMYWNGTSYVKAKGSGTYANGAYFKKGGPVPMKDGKPCYECGGYMKDGGKFNYNPFIRKNGNYWTYLDYMEDDGNIAELKQGGPIGYVPASINTQPQILKQTDGVYHMAHGGPIEYVPAPMNVQPQILKRTNGVAHMREGGINNPGFKALPVAVQEKIKARMEFGGVHMPTPMKKDGGYWKYYGYDEDDGNIAELKEGGIHIAPSKRGTFTAAATKHGKSVQAFASQVLANKENYSPAMVKKANFARNAAKWKHEYGGPVDPMDEPMPQYATGGRYMQEGGGTNPYANMVMGQIGQMQQKIGQLGELVNQDTELEPWVTTKMTLANDYLNSVENYLEHNPEAQQAVMRMGGHMNPFSAIAQFANGGVYEMQTGGGQYTVGQYVQGKGYWDGATFVSTPPGVTSDQISPEGSQAVILNAPSSNTPVDAFKSNSVYDTTVYNPTTDPNNPVNNPPPMPKQGQYASRQGAVYDTTDTTDTTGIKDNKMIAGTEYSKRRPSRGAIIGGILGGIATGAGLVSAERIKRDVRNNDINRGGSWNMAMVQGNKGSMPNVNRMSGPGSVISQPGNFAASRVANSGFQAQMGGMMSRNNMYQEGGVYDMDDAEIADLISKGYKVQYI
jgi:hypothetical protein